MLLVFRYLRRTVLLALAAALVLSLLAARRSGPAELLHGRTRYTMIKRKTAQPAGGAAEAFRALEAEADAGAQLDHTDGLRVVWPERKEWLHVRASGTEPILRIISEAPDAARAEALADWAGVHVDALSGG